MKEKMESGQALVEFALILPILLLLVLGIVNFAYAFAVHANAMHAIREGARYGMVHPEDTPGICDRVIAQLFLDNVELSQITVTYDDAGTSFTCDSPGTGVDGGLINAGEDRISVSIEHDVPAVAPIARASFHIDFVARRTITAVGG